MDEIDVKQIKEINNQCNAYKKKASELLAEKEYKTKTLNEMCVRLSEILGIQVTTDNLEEVYKQRVDKIKSTLKVCNDMIERIKLQESGVSLAEPKAVENTAGQTQAQVVGNTAGQNQVVGNTAGQNQVQMVGNTARQSMQAQSLGGLPESTYKLPEGMLDIMLDVMPNRSQTIGQQAVSQVNNTVNNQVNNQTTHQASSQTPGARYANLGGTVNLKSFMASVPKNDVDDIY